MPTKKTTATKKTVQKPEPPTQTQWFKKPLWPFLALFLVGAIAYFAIGNNKEVSQVEASQISDLQKQLAELQAEKESEELKAQAAAAEKSKKQEIADLIAAAEARAKKEALAEAKAKAKEEVESDFSGEGIPVDKEPSPTPPEWAGLYEIETIIDEVPVTVGLPLRKTDVGPRPYIGEIRPNVKFGWREARWMRLDIIKVKLDGRNIPRPGFNPLRRNSDQSLVTELWVLAPTNPTGG